MRRLVGIIMNLFNYDIVVAYTDTVSIDVSYNNYDKESELLTKEKIRSETIQFAKTKLIGI